jgi:NodT family efflux transporter outer membrane factor (OMF) lipoprotein
MTHRTSGLRRIRWLALAAALSGCAVGPNFKPPPPPSVTGYTPQPLPPQTASAPIAGGEVQRFVAGMDIPGQWWTLFHSPALNELVEQALKNNPSVRAAQAALRQANENVKAQRGSYFPTVQAGYNVTREKNAVGTLAPTLSSGAELFTLHTAQVNVSYVLDLFGANRRQVESLQALADAQRYELAGTYLTLSSNVVAAAVQEASLRAQVTATQDIVQSGRESLAILRHQLEIGAIAQLDVMAQESALAASEATLPALQKQLAQQDDLLAILTGRFPADAAVAQFSLADLQLPQDLPLSVPSKLVRQRPDVLQAEAQLHAASAQVGVAIADLLPQIAITAQAGGASTSVASLLASGNTFWSAGANLTQTLFAGGALWHHKLAADAALDQAGEQYRSVVLAAFQNVADTLQALELDADGVRATQRAEAAAATSLTATRRNVEIGAVGYLALLSAEQAYQQAALNLAQALANRYADTAALFQALGGGWWSQQVASADEQRPRRASN